jgi:hypothetical protein
MSVKNNRPESRTEPDSTTNCESKDGDLRRAEMRKNARLWQKRGKDILGYF